MEKFSIFRLRNWVKVVLGVLVVGLLVAFAENWYASQPCEKVTITLNEGSKETPLLSSQDIKNLLSEFGRKPLEGKSFETIDLSFLESRVKSSPLVKDCQIARNLRGWLEVHVQTHRPIARLIQTDLPDNGLDRYLNEEGRFMPLSERYTARVMLLSGPYFERKNHLRARQDTSLFHLIEAIQTDSLWRAQLEWMEVDAAGNIILWPQVGDTAIEYGPAIARDVKFQKINLFFREILPLRGWKSFSKVSVRYKNQLVCTKTDTLLALRP
ncbi:hypothetical protein BWI93_24220 [Siphonobacter sp. BAB-5385]|uniref:cell division protein FtsQ/DivIB n=1 Tax=unclassified Siphonobacter TaxID=2635712 RepID=UPI000B9EEC96|nr:MULTISPECIES: hypothetical protein [unclassified Siphonobacter]OZI05555.1 hypothetical protein BWI93_24220 [Siphonobacter sp. BAB-5385]PMD95887.1 hypothetical protein BWI97_13525 [Siphonobacter sp. BAB-5405]